MPLSPFFIRMAAGVMYPTARQISCITVSIPMPKSMSPLVMLRSLFMTDESIMPARNTFMTILLRPLLNSGPTSFVFAHIYPSARMMTSSAIFSNITSIFGIPQAKS